MCVFLVVRGLLPVDFHDLWICRIKYRRNIYQLFFGTGERRVENILTYLLTDLWPPWSSQGSDKNFGSRIHEDFSFILRRILGNWWQKPNQKYESLWDILGLWTLNLKWEENLEITISSRVDGIAFWAWTAQVIFEYSLQKVQHI